MIVDTIWLTCKLEEQAKFCLEYAMKWQKIQKNSQKTHKKTAKIAKKWPKYHLDHENYSPIGAHGRNPTLFQNICFKIQTCWPECHITAKRTQKR